MDKYYLYTDASHIFEQNNGKNIKENGFDYIAGYIANEQKEIIFVFYDYRKTINTGANEAELFAIKKGLEYAYLIGIENINIYSDSLSNVNNINKLLFLPKKFIKSKTKKQNNKIEDYINLFKNISISHIYRDNNKLPDLLCNYSQSYFTNNFEAHKLFKEYLKKFTSLNNSKDFIEEENRTFKKFNKLLDLRFNKLNFQLKTAFKNGL